VSRSRHRLPPLDRHLLLAAIAVVTFLWSWTFLDHWFYAHGRIVDIGVYQGYGLMVRAHEVPYRDFAVDYPPGSLPVFIAPTFVGHPAVLNDYGTWFARLMAVCGLGCLAALLVSRPPRRGVVFFALAPLLVGSLVLTRFDLWPTALMTVALAAFVRDRHRSGWFALALAISAKLFPLVLVPLAASWTYRRRGRRVLAESLAIWLGTLAAVFLPFAIVAPHGLWESLWGQVSRPIQIESLVGAYLMTFVHPGLIISHDALAIGGHDTLALATTVLEVATLVGLWAAFARSRADEQRLLRYAAASVCAFVAFGKVLSPQYLIWLVPLVALVRGGRGLVAIVLLSIALVVTQFYFALPRYDAYIDSYRYAWYVLGRDLTLVAILAVLALPGWPLPAPRRTARALGAARAG
jgi:hypothetical protein